DRAELAERYTELSEASRRLRFGSAPDRLSPRMLDRLLDVDGEDRVAWAAFAIDEPGRPGVGIARYSRGRDDPATAEAAVTVLDSHQGRGIGAILLHHLVDSARDHGIRTLTATVMWENVDLLDALRDHG